MNTPVINFKERRDFGQILNTTFLFARQNMRLLGKALLIYAGPFILIAGFTSGLYQLSSINYNPASLRYGDYEHLTSMIMYLSIYMAGLILSNTMIMATVYGYLKLYIQEGKENITLDKIWALIRKNYFRLLLSAFLGGLMIVVGFLFCILPGVYLAISFSFLFVIMVYEEKGFGSALRRSFSLTHFQFWWTLLIVMVLGFIIGLVGYLFSLPQVILSFVYTTNSLSSGSEMPESGKYIMIILAIVATAFNSMLSAIPFIGITLQYFNIVEQKESPALLQKIEEIGQN